jgi:putative phosphoesterase
MRLAVLSDIHGNLPALESVLVEIQRETPDAILIAGDMAAGPQSAEVIQRLRRLGCSMIRGNNENYLLRYDSGEAPEWWYTSHQWALIRWTYDQLDAETLEFIASLADEQIHEFPGTDSIRMVHGSPRDPDEHLYPGYDPAPLKIALTQTAEPVLICGHTHIPWQVRENGRLAFNPGAVCGPLNGDTGAQYAILTWEHDHWEVQYHSVPYDLDLVRESFKKSGLLDEGGPLAHVFLRSIETGQNLALDFITLARQMADEAGYTDIEYIPDDIWEQAADKFGIGVS